MQAPTSFATDGEAMVAADVDAPIPPIAMNIPANIPKIKSCQSAALFFRRQWIHNFLLFRLANSLSHAPQFSFHPDYI
jgi:hypothetical protein